MKILQNNFIKRRTSADDSILRMLFPSVLGIIVCMICLAGMSWAWFTAGVQSQSTIKAASYTLGETVTVKADGSSEASSEDVVKKSSDGTYHLAANKEYVVTLKPEAAPQSGGYCIVKITDNDDSSKVKYCTEGLKSGESFSFTISNGGKAAVCQLIAAWGSSEDSKLADHNRCSSGDVITVNGGAPDKASDKTDTGKDTTDQSPSSGTEVKTDPDRNVQDNTDSRNIKESSSGSANKDSDSGSTADDNDSSSNDAATDTDQTDTRLRD